MWMPYTNNDKPDLFATTGDYLRIWELKGNSVVNRCVLNSVCISFTYSLIPAHFITFYHIFFNSKLLDVIIMHRFPPLIGTLPIQI